MEQSATAMACPDCHALTDDLAAHWSTILVSTFSDRASMHPGCRQVTALLA
jgi:hypothetical protein